MRWQVPCRVGGPLAAEVGRGDHVVGLHKHAQPLLDLQRLAVRPAPPVKRVRHQRQPAAAEAQPVPRFARGRSPRGRGRRCVRPRRRGTHPRLVRIRPSCSDFAIIGLVVLGRVADGPGRGWQRGVRLFFLQHDRQRATRAEAGAQPILPLEVKPRVDHGLLLVKLHVFLRHLLHGGGRQDRLAVVDGGFRGRLLLAARMATSSAGRVFVVPDQHPVTR
mmetsp:Transcript_14275/g.35447  ORF Transcript_14275/g.35447 Transcript_14275/m.35447 type:complete len:219 (+) Transcript_14275:3674-4330(+)